MRCTEREERNRLRAQGTESQERTRDRPNELEGEEEIQRGKKAKRHKENKEETREEEKQKWPTKPYREAEALFKTNEFLRSLVERAREDGIKDQEACCAQIECTRGVKVHSMNANGIRARRREEVFENYLRRELPDVLLVQEFRCSSAKFFAKARMKELLQELSYGLAIINACEFNFGYAGTEILSRVPVLGHEFLEEDKEGRMISVDFGAFALANVYSPNSGRPGELKTMPKREAFEKKLRRRVKELQKLKPTIVVGNLNVTAREKDMHEQWDPELWAVHPSSTEKEKSGSGSYASSQT